MSPQPDSRPDWPAIDTVLLDLDGTLLDQAYDNHIWRDLVPQRFAVARGLELHAAYAEIARAFAERSGTLDWYCIEYWSRDAGRRHRCAASRSALARRVAAGRARIPRAHARQRQAAGAAHELASGRAGGEARETGVLDYLDAAVTSHEFGAPKEQAQFWQAALARFAYRPGAQPVRRRQFEDARGRAQRRNALGVRRAALGHEGLAARARGPPRRRRRRRPGGAGCQKS